VTPPSKLRSEIINLRQQLAEKAAATPVLRQTISILEKNIEDKAPETVGTPKSALGSKINQLEEERTEPQPPTTPVPKLRERIRTLEEELEHEHAKNQTERRKLMKTMQKIEAELQTKSNNTPTGNQNGSIVPRASGVQVCFILHFKCRDHHYRSLNNISS
jgi:chromosome segregation ATPase